MIVIYELSEAVASMEKMAVPPIFIKPFKINSSVHYLLDGNGYPHYFHNFDEIGWQKFIGEPPKVDTSDATIIDSNSMGTYQMLLP